MGKLELYSAELSSIINVRREFIESFSIENKISETQLLNIISGIGRKIIKKEDVVVAFIGSKDNDYFKQIIEFSKRDLAFKC